MKAILTSIFLAAWVVACNNESKTKTVSEDSTAINDESITNPETTKTGKTETKKTEPAAVDYGICGQMVLFDEGTVIEGHSVSPNGTETNKQKSTVTKVSRQGSGLVAEVTMESGSKEKGIKPFTARYVCTGSALLVDMTSLFSNFEKDGVSMKGDPIQFPLRVKVGDNLPDASYFFTISQFAKAMKITTFIKNRKIESKETITTPAGSFDAFKVTADVDAESELEGADEKVQNMLKAMKAKMPKQSFVMWYTPKVGIVKVEMYSNGKLINSSEITSIKKS